MENFKRYAIYFAPEPGPLANFGASWLGWDPVTGKAVAHPDLPCDVAQITRTPRKYGFHGTIKPPFRLAQGVDIGTLHGAVQALAQTQAPVVLEGLALTRLGSFLAITPVGDASALAALAGAFVTELDTFRAPLSDTEIARRNPDRLSTVQRDLLTRWGYPYVLDEFRFHLTLSGRLPADQAGDVADLLRPILAPMLPTPFPINSLCLFGEAEDGMFHHLHRYRLSG